MAYLRQVDQQTHWSQRFQRWQGSATSGALQVRSGRSYGLKCDDKSWHPYTLIFWLKATKKTWCTERLRESRLTTSSPEIAREHYIHMWHLAHRCKGPLLRQPEAAG